MADFVADFFLALGGMGAAGESDGLRVTLPLAELRDGGKKGMEALGALADDLIGQDEAWPPPALEADPQDNPEDPDNEPTRPRRPTKKQVRGLKAVPTGYPALEELQESAKDTADVLDPDLAPDPLIPGSDPKSRRGIYLLIGITLIILAMSTLFWFLR